MHESFESSMSLQIVGVWQTATTKNHNDSCAAAAIDADICVLIFNALTNNGTFSILVFCSSICPPLAWRLPFLLAALAWVSMDLLSEALNIWLSDPQIGRCGR